MDLTHKSLARSIQSSNKTVPVVLALQGDTEAISRLLQDTLDQQIPFCGLQNESFLDNHLAIVDIEAFLQCENATMRTRCCPICRQLSLLRCRGKDQRLYSLRACSWRVRAAVLSVLLPNSEALVRPAQRLFVLEGLPHLKSADGFFHCTPSSYGRGGRANLVTVHLD
jgi:hypothetical protein